MSNSPMVARARGKRKNIMVSKVKVSNHELVRAALARAMWHAGPGQGVSKDDFQELYQKDRVEMVQRAERVIMFLERQGVSMTSLDS
jgi:hypothetical protein